MEAALMIRARLSASDGLPIDAVHLLADGLALVYHEARNVRHLISAKHLQPTGWELLLSVLPRDRFAAWKAIRPTRERAASARTASDACTCFEQRYARNLTDLESLYEDAHWKHAAAYGGHQWLHITAAVIILRKAITERGLDAIATSARALLCARHNNGTLREKILRLDAQIGIDTGAWWS